MSYALARPMKSCCKLLVPLWAGRRNSMQVEINTSYNFRIMRTDCCNICNLSLFLSSGMFSISQMKNRPMILIGGWHSCTYKDLIRVSLMFCIRIGADPHPCTFLLKDQRMLNQKVQLWLNFTLAATTSKTLVGSPAKYLCQYSWLIYFCFPAGTTSQTFLPKLQDSKRAFPISSQLKNDSFLSPATTHHLGSRKVLNREDCLCLSDSTNLTQEASVCCSGTLMSGGTHVKMHINTEKPNHNEVASLPSAEIDNDHISCHTKTECFRTHTNVTSYVNEVCLRNAQALSPNVLTSHVSRTPGEAVFCTLLIDAKINQRNHPVRFCHSQICNKVASCKQSESNQTTDLKAQLTHTDAQGRATMVDVGGKLPTCRTAVACATVSLGPTAFRLLRDNQLAKGDALTVAQLAGIMASKQTSTLIPLCHPLPLDHTSVTFHLDELLNAVVITATCRTTGRTGVEMEALTAASVTALTVYDMCKAVSHDIIITDIKLVSKTGGKKDFHRHSKQEEWDQRLHYGFPQIKLCAINEKHILLGSYLS